MLLAKLISFFFIWWTHSQWAEASSLIHEVSISHSDTPHSVGLFWSSDQLVSETSTSQHTTLTTDQHPCARRDSKPQCQPTSARSPMP